MLYAGKCNFIWKTIIYRVILVVYMRNLMLLHCKESNCFLVLLPQQRSTIIYSVEMMGSMVPSPALLVH